MVKFTPIVAASLFAAAARGANDWSKPCFGQCQWDIPSGPTTGSGTVQLLGAENSVSDITQAAGWEILDCDPSVADQDIRVVCANPEMGCDKLYQGGAKGTVVRLPKSCGSVPFAIVNREWTHENQDIPKAKRARISRRQDGGAPVVKGIALTTDFAAADAGQGNVTLFLAGSSIPDAAGNFTLTNPNEARSLEGRGLFSKIGDALKKISQIHKELKGSTPVHFEKDANLFNKTFGCTALGNAAAVSGRASVGVSGRLDGTVDYGVAATGALLPIPKLTEFGMFVGLDAALTGTLAIDADVTGSVTSGKILLFEAGIPGLDFPGILTIGPSFTVNAEATASLDAFMNTNISLSYLAKDAKLFFPPSSGESGSFTPGDNNLKLALSPNVTVHGNIAAHLLPGFNFGISAIGGKAKAAIDLTLDATTGLDMTLNAGAVVASTNGAKPTVGAGASGCVAITSGLGVKAGADADLFDLFKKGEQVSLFQKTFTLFKKCFTAQARRAPQMDRAVHAALAKRDFSCPKTPLGAAAPVLEEAVPGSSLA